jgi:hypothetical protein
MLNDEIEKKIKFDTIKRIERQEKLKKKAKSTLINRPNP